MQKGKSKRESSDGKIMRESVKGAVELTFPTFTCVHHPDAKVSLDLSRKLISKSWAEDDDDDDGEIDDDGVDDTGSHTSPIRRQYLLFSCPECGTTQKEFTKMRELFLALSKQA